VPGHDVAASARRLVTAIDRLDAEVESLASEADLGEIARLEGKLGATALVGDATSDANEAHRELRTLLLNELEVRRRCRAQHDLAVVRRRHLTDLLRRLWALLAEGDAPRRDTLTRGDSEQRLRALLAQIDDQVNDTTSPARRLQPAERS
jgi:hypothetical protein